MPQLAFLQVIVVAAVAAILGVGLSIPVGGRLGSRAGQTLRRGSVLVLLAVVAGSLLWGHSSGELAQFNSRLGGAGWLEITVFFWVILSIGYRFSGSYLRERAFEEYERASASRRSSEGAAAAPEEAPDA